MSRSSKPRRPNGWICKCIARFNAIRIPRQDLPDSASSASWPNSSPRTAPPWCSPTPAAVPNRPPTGSKNNCLSWQTASNATTPRLTANCASTSKTASSAENCGPWCVPPPLNSASTSGASTWWCCWPRRRGSPEPCNAWDAPGTAFMRSAVDCSWPPTSATWSNAAPPPCWLAQATSTAFASPKHRSTCWPSTSWVWPALPRGRATTPTNTLNKPTPTETSADPISMRCSIS